MAAWKQSNGGNESSPLPLFRLIQTVADWVQKFWIRARDCQRNYDCTLFCITGL